MAKMDPNAADMALAVWNSYDALDLMDQKFWKKGTRNLYNTVPSKLLINLFMCTRHVFDVQFLTGWDFKIFDNRVFMERFECILQN
jgi:hypothetical protein